MPDRRHGKKQSQRLVGERRKAVFRVETSCVFVYRIHDNTLHSYGLRRYTDRLQCVHQEMCAEALTFAGFIHSQSCNQDRSDATGKAAAMHSNRFHRCGS